MATALRRDGTEHGRELVLTRFFAAPRTQVFAAWTDAERLIEWWGPRGFVLRRCQADVRPGGAWRVESSSPEGSEHNCGGVYREVAPVERLVFTMAWDGTEDGEPGRETLVSVDFAEDGAGTRLTFRQALFSSREARDGHDEGWSSSFELLEEYLARQGGLHA